MKNQLERFTFFTAFLMIVMLSTSFASAQTFQPPQIPNYDLPNAQNGGITIPGEPANPGVPKGLPDITPTPTPTQTDYSPIAIVIVIVAVIIVGIAAWTVIQKRKTLPLPPFPPN